MVPHFVDGQYRLVGHLHAVRLLPGDVLVGQHGGDTRNREGGTDVEMDDARPGMRAAQGGAPEGAAQMEIGRVGEVADDLERPVGSGRGVADAPAVAVVGWRLRPLDDRRHDGASTMLGTDTASALRRASSSTL